MSPQGVLLAVCACTILGAGCTSSLSQTSDTYRPPVGRLEHQLGTYLRIEGIRADSGKVGSSTLSVDTINGRPCSPPRDIWLDNLSLPVGVRCQVSGFESGRWIGIPPEVSEADGVSPRQAMWQFQTYFVVTAIQGPESLRQSAPGFGG